MERYLIPSDTCKISSPFSPSFSNTLKGVQYFDRLLPRSDTGVYVDGGSDTSRIRRVDGRGGFLPFLTLHRSQPDDTGTSDGGTSPSVGSDAKVTVPWFRSFVRDRPPRRPHSLGPLPRLHTGRSRSPPRQGRTFRGWTLTLRNRRPGRVSLPRPGLDPSKIWVGSSSPDSTSNSVSERNQCDRKGFRVGSRDRDPTWGHSDTPTVPSVFFTE